MKFFYIVASIMIFHIVFLSETAEAGSPSHEKTVEVQLVRSYLDGEKSVEVVNMTVESMENLLEIFEGWQLIGQNGKQFTFHKEIQDISPLLKTNGYFGLSEDGILTIYEGKPKEDNAIQSFYQLNIDKLESKMANELKAGIPIKSKKNYLSWINELKRFEK